MTVPPASYDWIREIKPELKALDDSPLTGASPPFPWEQLASHLAQSFEREQIMITPGEIQWRSKDLLYEGLGDTPYPLVFAIPTLQGTACWVMPEQEMAVLETLLLTKETHPITFQDRELSEAFYRFLALEVLFHMSQISFDKTIAPILTGQNILPQENALCWDISATIQGQVLWGRLIISSDLRRSWVEHFTRQSSVLSQKMTQLIEPVIHLEIGKVSLNFDEWSQVNAGDYLLLDTCTLDPETLSGRLALTINGKLAFRAKLKDKNVKILEFPLYHEVNTPMAKHDEDDEDEDFDDFDDLTVEDDHTQLEEDDHTEIDTDLDLEDETDDFFDSDEEIEEKETAVEAPPKQAVPSEDNKETVATPLKTEEKTKSFSIKQIPLDIVVEIGRIQMSMEKVIALEPGNLLELNLHPEDGVDLVINGKTVGKGELIRIGEALGVRILELG